MSVLKTQGLIAALILAGAGASALLPDTADAREKEGFSIALDGAQAEGDRAQDLASLEALSDASKGRGLIDKYSDYKVILHHLTGLPTHMVGNFPTGDRGVRAERVAEAFLGAHRAAFGLDGEGVTLLREGVSADPGGLDHSRFSLFVQGVPVEGAEVIVHSERGIVRSVDASLVPTRDLHLKVEISPEDAADLASEDLQNKINGFSHLDGGETFRYRRIKAKGDAALTWLNLGIITGEEGGTVPAWKLDVNGWRYFVSAATGEILFSYDNNQAALYRMTYHAHNETIVPGTLVLNEDTENPADVTLDVDILDAHLYVGEVYDFYLNTFGRDSWDGQGSELASTVHYGQNYSNAFWNGSQMVYGDGDRMVQDDICAHEVSHGVVQSTAGLIYLHQPGAVNEAVADVMAYFMTQDPLIGEGMRGGAIRDISDPAAFGQPDHMDEYRFIPKFYDNGGVHIFSGIVSHTAYLLAEGGQKSGITVPAQGFETAQAIWYHALSNYMLPVSNFAHTRVSLEGACGALYGEGSEACLAVSAAFDAQGIS